MSVLVILIDGNRLKINIDNCNWDYQPTCVCDQWTLAKIGRFWHFTLNFFKNWQYVLVCKLYRGVPLFRYSIILKSSSIKYSICRKSSYARSNLKKYIKKNFHRTRVSGNRVPCKNFFYKCDCSIFREPYSNVFKPYSDVLKPYSGVFLQIFLEVWLTHIHGAL